MSLLTYWDQCYNQSIVIIVFIFNMYMQYYFARVLSPARMCSSCFIDLFESIACMYISISILYIYIYIYFVLSLAASLDHVPVALFYYPPHLLGPQRRVLGVFIASWRPHNATHDLVQRALL